MESETLAPGRRLGGRYDLVARLGDGGFGDVWRAVDTRLSDRPVAVKVLKGEFADRADVVARFEAEADALARLAHPNVVFVLDRGHEGDARYIVTELVEGESLAAWLDRARAAGAPPDLTTVRALFDQVCAGVAAAHQVSVPGAIVHRDLKPDNVIVRVAPSGDALAKVLDFGVAQLGGRRGTSTGMLLGTPLYMAPEQAMGQVTGVGPWSDVFALAVLLVEMLSLHAHSQGEETWWATALRSGGHVLPMLSSRRGDVPPAVWVTLARALHPDASQRPPDAGALRATLRAAWEHAPSMAAPRTTAMYAMPAYAQSPTAAPWPQQPVLMARPSYTQMSPRAPGMVGPLVVGGLFIALATASGVWFVQRSGPREPRPTAYVPYVRPAYNPPVPPPRPTRPVDDPDRVYTLAPNPSAPARGPASAPVTVVVVSDFQCPFCARVGPTLARVQETYGDRVRLVWRNYPLPFHPRAMPAAIAAIEVQRQLGDAGFWRLHDVMFASQARLTDDDLVSYAEALGADGRRVRRALLTREHEPAVRTDMAAFTASGARAGTPCFFVNGRMLRGAQPYERFVEAIDRALAAR
jgi:serine/threonine protein kinase/protein-disulfide isomerase